jgi:hypothetical protein
MLVYIVKLRWIANHIFFINSCGGRHYHPLLYNFMLCMLQGNCPSSWLWPMARAFTEWTTSLSNCSTSKSTCDWTSPFSHALSSTGLFSVVWVCGSSWFRNRGSIHVHHGSREAYSSHDICNNYFTFSKTLVCIFSVQNTQSPSSMGPKILHALCTKPWED